MRKSYIGQNAVGYLYRFTYLLPGGISERGSQSPVKSAILAPDPDPRARMVLYSCHRKYKTDGRKSHIRLDIVGHLDRWQSNKLEPMASADSCYPPSLSSLSFILTQGYNRNFLAVTRDTKHGSSLILQHCKQYLTVRSIHERDISGGRGRFQESVLVATLVRTLADYFR